MRKIAAVVGIGIVLVLAGIAVLAQSPRSFYKPKEGLTGKLLFEVGQTGKSPGRDKWAVEPSGEWTLTRRGEKEPSAKGKLTEAQMKAIASHFATMRFESMPERIGLPAEDLVSEETRHFISLTFGKKRTVLISKESSFSDAMPAAEWEEAEKKGYEKKEEPEKKGDYRYGRERDATHEDWSRFVALTLVLKDLMKPAEQ